MSTTSANARSDSAISAPGRVARMKIAAALVLIACAVVVVLLATRLSGPQFNPQPHEALGQVLAEEAGKLAAQGGGVTLIALDTSVYPNPSADFMVQGFLRTARELRLKLSATNWVELDPIRLVRVPPGDFFEILRNRPEGEVVVSLLGPPLLAEEQRAKLARKHPKIVALCSGELPKQVDLGNLFNLELLHTAVISRPHPAGGPPTAQNPRAWFDHYYQVITRANLAELPAPSHAPPR